MSNSSPIIIVAALIIIGLILAALNASNTATNPNLITPTPVGQIDISPVLSLTPMPLSPTPSVTNQPNNTPTVGSMTVTTIPTPLVTTILSPTP